MLPVWEPAWQFGGPVHSVGRLCEGLAAAGVTVEVLTTTAGLPAWPAADTGVPLHPCASLEAAVGQARALARVGDAVLLSPACASWDMFRDYAHRAEVFVAAVRALAEEAGQPC